MAPVTFLINKIIVIISPAIVINKVGVFNSGIAGTPDEKSIRPTFLNPT